MARSPSVSGGSSSVAFGLGYRSISSSPEVPGELVSVVAQNPKPDERKRSRAEELEHGKRERTGGVLFCLAILTLEAL